MIIGYDAKKIATDPGMVGESDRGLIRALGDNYPDSRLMLYTPKLKKYQNVRKISELHNVEFRLPAPSGFSGELWRLFGVANCLQADKIQLFHGLDNLLPLNIKVAKIPTVVTFHDLRHLTVPERYNFLQKKYLDHLYRKTCENATRIIVTDEEAADILRKAYGVSPDRIDIPIHTDTTFRVADFLMEVYNKAIYSQYPKS